MPPEQNPSPKPQSAPAQDAPEPSAPKAKVKKAIRDWKPLGEIRDSFYEQLKQDQFR